MSSSASRIRLIAGLIALPLCGCVAGGGYPGAYPGAYAEAPSVATVGYPGIGADYYAFGAAIGGWGPGYYVGPYRGGGGPFRRGPGYGAGRPVAHAYRPAPAGRRMPSIPSRGRSGGASPVFRR